VIDSPAFRKLVGSFGSGVTIVSSGSDGHFHAMTASAFTSVSLEPPMVLVCVDKSAETAAIISRHGYFGVNVLAAGQEAISNACAKRGTPESNGLVGVDHCLGPLGLPLLAGCLANFECRTVHEYDGGDHLIFVGEVASGSLGEAEEPLFYFRGSYGTFTPS
jgi:3-hydroxy-9,10-secoandrosta-1,3,5(10)-triene-9,17-dione monooxygenase reductase component